MRTFFSSLAAFFAVAAQAVTPASPPHFETLFVGVLELGDVGTINNSTFGTRLYGPITGSVDLHLQTASAILIIYFAEATSPTPPASMLPRHSLARQTPDLSAVRGPSSPRSS